MSLLGNTPFDGLTAEWKYLISGEAVDRRKISVVAKFGASAQIVYILTVYAE